MTVEDMKKLKEGDKIRLIRDVNFDEEAYMGLRGKYESLVRKGREYVFESPSNFRRDCVFTKVFKLRDIDPALADVTPVEGNLLLRAEDIELVRTDYKKAGLCPKCGDEGTFRLMALVCRQGHGLIGGC